MRRMTLWTVTFLVLTTLILSALFVLYAFKAAQKPIFQSIKEKNIQDRPWEILDKYTADSKESDSLKAECRYVPALKKPTLKLINSFFAVHYFGVERPVMMSDFMLFLDRLNDRALQQLIRDREDVNINPSVQYESSGRFWNGGEKINHSITLPDKSVVKIKVASQLGGQYSLSRDKNGLARVALTFNPDNLRLCKQILWWDACASLKAVYLSQTGILIIFDKEQANFCAKF